MRKWGWRGAGILAGVIVAAGFGLAGQWPGGLAGAGLIGVGIYAAPEVSGWLRDRRGRAAGLLLADQAASDLLDHVSSPAMALPASQIKGGAAWWLRPDQRVVEFIGRPELAQLRDWCADERASQVVLATGMDARTADLAYLGPITCGSVLDGKVSASALLRCHLPRTHRCGGGGVPTQVPGALRAARQSGPRPRTGRYSPGRSSAAEAGRT
jgi:hypothetical protein